MEGLKTFDVLDLIRRNPNKMRQLFVFVLTADFMIDLFVPVLSPKGSNQREVVDSVVVKWSNYLQMIEGSLS